MTTVENLSVENLLAKAYALRTHNVFGSIALVEQIISESDAILKEDILAKCYSHLCLFYMITGEFDKALKFGELARSLYQKIKDTYGEAIVKYNMAGVYYKSDNYYLGLVYLKECLTIFENQNDYFNISRTLKSLGTIYEYFSNVNEAENCYHHAIVAGEKANDLNLISNVYNPLSGMWLDQGRVNEAMELIQKSIEIKLSTNDIRGLAFALYGRGKVFIKLGNFKEAEADFLESLAIHKKMGEKLGKGMAELKLGKLYFEIGEFYQAKKILNQALEFARIQNIVLINYKACYLLYKINKEEKNTQTALEFLETYITEKERVINLQSLKLMESYETLGKLESMRAQSDFQNERLQLIEKKNQELDSFFYRVAHDLKGPISTLKGLDFLAREMCRDQKMITYLDAYQAQVNRINLILNQLIKLTMLNHGKNTSENIDFQQLIEDCILSYTYLPNFEKINFTQNIDSAVVYKAEWAQVNTIIQNLIENAIKYADLKKSKSEVWIKLYADEAQTVCLEVKDNGIGMNKETLDHLFDMFFRAENSSAEGSGIGLYILKRAVENLKGSISVVSEPNNGTTFTILLPIS